MNITNDDLLEALRDALGPTGDGLTMQDLVEKTGWSRGTVSAKLHELNRSGRLAVTKVKRPDLSGRAQSVPAYRIK